jgi:hypothetical protein
MAKTLGTKVTFIAGPHKDRPGIIVKDKGDLCVVGMTDKPAGEEFVDADKRILKERK